MDAWIYTFIPWGVRSAGCRVSANKVKVRIGQHLSILDVMSLTWTQSFGEDCLAEWDSPQGSSSSVCSVTHIVAAWPLVLQSSCQFGMCDFVILSQCKTTVSCLFQTSRLGLHMATTYVCANFVKNRKPSPATPESCLRILCSSAKSTLGTAVFSFF